MAKKYLDETGLSQVWNKMKSTFATPSDITTALGTVYKVKGSCTTAQLPTTDEDREQGDVWNLTDAGTYGPAGTNVVWNGTDWDPLAGTYSTFNSTTAGLVPAPGTENTGKFLKSDGTWAEVSLAGYVKSISVNNGEAVTPDETGKASIDIDTYTLELDSTGSNPDVFTSTSDGLVPAPTAANLGKFLKGDGTWAEIDGIKTYENNPANRQKLNLASFNFSTVGSNDARYSGAMFLVSVRDNTDNNSSGILTVRYGAYSTDNSLTRANYCVYAVLNSNKTQSSSVKFYVDTTDVNTPKLYCEFTKSGYNRVYITPIHNIKNFVWTQTEVSDIPTTNVLEVAQTTIGDNIPIDTVIPATPEDTHVLSTKAIDTVRRYGNYAHQFWGTNGAADYIHFCRLKTKVQWNDELCKFEISGRNIHGNIYFKLTGGGGTADANGYRPIIGPSVVYQSDNNEVSYLYWNQPDQYTLDLYWKKAQANEWYGITSIDIGPYARAGLEINWMDSQVATLPEGSTISVFKGLGAIKPNELKPTCMWRTIYGNNSTGKWWKFGEIKKTTDYTGFACDITANSGSDYIQAKLNIGFRTATEKPSDSNYTVLVANIVDYRFFSSNNSLSSFNYPLDLGYKFTDGYTCELFVRKGTNTNENFGLLNIYVSNIESNINGGGQPLDYTWVSEASDASQLTEGTGVTAFSRKGVALADKAVNAVYHRNSDASNPGDITYINMMDESHSGLTLPGTGYWHVINNQWGGNDTSWPSQFAFPTSDSQTKNCYFRYSNNSTKYGSGWIQLANTKDTFSKKGLVNNTTDWNTLTEPGTYKVQCAGWGAAATYHSPNSYSATLYAYGLLNVFASNVSDEKRIMQIYYPHGGPTAADRQILFRMHNSNDMTAGWSAWAPIFANTWRGIQNNLTSTSTTDSLSAAQGKILNDKFGSYVAKAGDTMTAGATLTFPNNTDDRKLVVNSSDITHFACTTNGWATGNLWKDANGQYLWYNGLYGTGGTINYAYNGTSYTTPTVKYKDGQVGIAGTLNIGIAKDNAASISGGCKMSYNSTDESLDFIF